MLCAEVDEFDDRILYCGQCRTEDEEQQSNNNEKRKKKRRTYATLRAQMKEPRKGLPADNASQEESDTETENEDEETRVTIVSRNDTNEEKETVPVSTAIVPQEITKNRTMSNCLISTITQSVEGNARFIPKDFFYKADQRVNLVYKEQYNNDWIALRDEIEKEIDEDVKLRMIRRAQQVGLCIDKKIVSSIKEIGQAFQNDDSIECATKINTILNADFRIRSGYERTIESVIMKRLNIQYTDHDSTAKGCVARMVVKRKCNIAKVINKRCNSSHQGKVSIKRSKEEVAALPV